MIELVGVVSIIAIIITLLVPRIYGIINDAKITHVLMSYRSMQAGVNGHYARWGGFRKVDGRPYSVDDYPVEDFDRVLFQGNYLEEPFVLPLGNGRAGDDGDPAMDPTTDGSRLRLLDISHVQAGVTPVTAGDTDTSGTYHLQPASTLPEGQSSSSPETITADITGSFLVEAIIPGVLLRDAQELNERIDGRDERLGALQWGDGSGDATEADYTGKVKWERGDSGTVTVFLYIAHY